MAITTDTGAKKISGTDNWREIFDDHNDTVDAYDKNITDLHNDIGIVVNGNKTAYSTGAAIGDYVILKNSTISDGIGGTLDDGLYTAAKAIPYDSAIDNTYLTAVSGGGLNALNSNLQTVEIWKHENITYTNASINNSGAGGYYSYGTNLTVPDGYMPIGATYDGDYSTGVFPVIYYTGSATKKVALMCGKSLTGVNVTVTVHYVKIHPI